MAHDFGYAGNILRVDLSSARVTMEPTASYIDRFIGGRGIAAKIYWDEVRLEVKSFDPANRLIFITGPLAGLSGLAGSRWQVCGKSPLTEPEHFCNSNLGGGWGAHLKFAGFDGIVIQGESEKPVYLLVHNSIAELRDASTLWGKNSVATRELLKSELGNLARMVMIGPAGENRVSMATMFTDDDSSGVGFGAVMGAKRLKAIVVLGGGKRPRVAEPERLQALTRYIRELLGAGSMQWLQAQATPAVKRQKQVCYGCVSGCERVSYEVGGDKGKFFCQPALLCQALASRYYKGHNFVHFQMARLCDKYGIDTKAIAAIVEWLSRCYRSGILSDENTGIPLSKLGSLEFVESLVKMMSYREGFGDCLAQGIHWAAESIGHKAKEMVTDYADGMGRILEYGARLYLTTGLFYATELKQPIAQIHEISRPVIKWKNWVNGVKGAYMSYDLLRAIANRFWGSELAADFSTYEGKALAAKIIQDREYARECLILCDKIWPIVDVVTSADHLGDPTIESKLYSAVTGNELDEAGAYRIGEKVFNLQRAILIREGHRGRKDDRLAEYNYTVPLETDVLNAQCLVPGENGRPLSRKGAVVDREKFEKVLDEYYQLRGWDIATGLQTKTRLEELELGDIATGLAGLIVD